MGERETGLLVVLELAVGAFVAMLCAAGWLAALWGTGRGFESRAPDRRREARRKMRAWGWVGFVSVGEPKCWLV